MSRKNARAWSMKFLYQMAMNNQYDLGQVEKFCDYHEIKNNEKEYLINITEIVVNNLDEIDKTIEENSNDWKIGRINNLDISILRLAIGEILYLDAIPDKVSINEAVELAKEYSTEKSSKFINGVLGSVLSNKNNE
ncbi:MAG: transcription antitermination factor NusB [Finegoldia sp.]|nr:transcription antitermination factor NusB [Finegoldia sp.]